MPYLVRSTIGYVGQQNPWNAEYAILDVDGDGDRDIIIAQLRVPIENVGNPLIVLLNDGSGGFTNGTSSIFPNGAPLTVHPRGIVVADFNGDGRPDLFIADHGYDTSPYPGAQNRLLLSSGPNGFVDATGRLPQVSDFSHSATAGDIDGDGDTDILVMNVYGGTPATGPTTAPYILVNDGAGNFTRRDDLLPAAVTGRDQGYLYLSCRLFDADGDGDLDLFAGTFGGDSKTTYVSRIYFNNGTGNFSALAAVDLPQGPFPTSPGVVSVTTADLNGDGRMDIIANLQGTDFKGHYIQLLINRASAGFVDETAQLLPQPAVLTGPWIHSIQAVDLNGDGYVDLIARDGQYPPIFLNDGTGSFINLPGSFLDYNNFGTPEGVHLLATDANGDGRIDLLASFPDQSLFLFTQQDPGPSQTGTANADALLGDASNETLIGLGGEDVIFGGAGNDIITGGAGADKMVGGAGADDFTDTAVNLNGDTIADFARGDRIVITDASGGLSLGWNGGVLTYGSTSISLSNLSNASITAGAASGGGIQIFYGGPALILSAGPSVPATSSGASLPTKTWLQASPSMPDSLDASWASSFGRLDIRLPDDFFG